MVVIVKSVYLHNPGSWCLELTLVLKRQFCLRDHMKQNLQMRAQESLPCPSMAFSHICTPMHHFRTYPFANLCKLLFGSLLFYPKRLSCRVCICNSDICSPVHKTWCHSPEGSNWKIRKRWLPTLCLCLVFMNFFTTLKPQHSKSIHIHAPRYALSYQCPFKDTGTIWPSWLLRNICI